MKTIKIIDLFAGLGGIRIGFTQAANEAGYKVECVLTSELKEYAVQAYKGYFGEDEKNSGDIRNIKDIPDFDFLLGGFPCQPFSTAGTRKGFADTRGTLFFEIERILADKKPKGFILENVEGLVSHDNGNTLTTIINKLKALHYNVTWKVLNSVDFGVAQNRKRIYIVGVREGTVSLDFTEVKQSVVKDILESNLELMDTEFTRKLLKNYETSELHGKAIKDKRGGKDNIHSWDICLRGNISKEEKKLLTELLKQRRRHEWAEKKGIIWMDGMPLTEQEISTFFKSKNLKKILANLTKLGYLKYEYPRNLKNGKRVPDETKEKGYNIVTGRLSFEITKILDSNGIAPTIVATDVGHTAVIDGNGVRRLSVREGLRLFGYPENYYLNHIEYKDAFDLLGNTVVIPVIKDISKRVIKTIH